MGFTLFFNFMCMGILPTSMSVHSLCVYLVPMEVWGPLGKAQMLFPNMWELGIETGSVPQHVGARN